MMVNWRKLESALSARSPREPAHTFAIRGLNGSLHVYGPHEVPEFTFVLNTPEAVTAVNSLDRTRIATAYIRGWVDVEGDFLSSIAAARLFNDFHPIAWAMRFAPRLVYGRTGHDDRVIGTHYDLDPHFFFSFLDSQYRCYTQGSYLTEDDSLEDAIGRKLNFALESLGLKPGAHVLDVGGGWGAFADFASKRDISVTSVTLSRSSQRYMESYFEGRRPRVNVVREHFLDFTSKTRFDAIVNMGTTEHIPNYRATLRKYSELLKPGGKIYLDALAMRAKHRVSSFMSRHIYGGSSSPLSLHGYLRCVARSPFTLTSVSDERENYFRTCRDWARRLDNARDDVCEQWGSETYRRFRLFLWGSAEGFASGKLQAYSWSLTLPVQHDRFTAT